MMENAILDSKKKLNMFSEIIKGIYRGKSVYRTLTNMEVRKISIDGQGIDLGAKSKNSSYYKYISMTQDTIISFTDLYSNEPEIVKIDLNNKFPLSDSTQDFVILMNVLEHLENYSNCIFESYRILKSSKPLIGVVPFIHKIHPDPDDCFRFSKTTLERLFHNAGFKEIKVTPLSCGPLSASLSLIMPLIPFKLLKGIIFSIVYVLDTIIAQMFKMHPAVRKDNFPLGYFFECTK